MRLRQGGRSWRLVPSLGLAGLAVYIGWLGGPYLRSIVVRDAAVTSWISLAAAPISGYIDKNPLYPGQIVGEDGRIVRIEDPRADALPLARARAELERTQAKVAAMAPLVGTIRKTAEVREALLGEYLVAMRSDIDSKISSSSRNLVAAQRRFELERAQADRMSALLQRGSASQSSADAATGRVTEHQRTLTDIQASLAWSQLRQRAATQGVLLNDDGTDAAAPQRSLEDARLALARAEAELAAAKVDEIAAQELVEAAEAAYDRARAADVSAPPGSMVWSLITAPGSAIQPGMPVATWLDCRIMLVDVPVSDVELALLHRGDAADVVLEGERATRHGAVMLTRGAAATVGQADLAALAKGRQHGTGQALVRLEPSAADVAACPVGHAAYVDFPGIGILDIVRARLRL